MWQKPEIQTPSFGRNLKDQDLKEVRGGDQFGFVQAVGTCANTGYMCSQQGGWANGIICATFGVYAV